METLSPGKSADYKSPEAPQKYAEEREKWLAAQATDTTYKVAGVVRGQYAVVEVKEKDEHLLVDAMATDKAIEVLRSRSKEAKPFFLAVGLVRPHFPFVSSERTISQYIADQTTVPVVPENDHEDIPPQAINSVLHFEKSPLQEMRRGYYGAF